MARRTAALKPQLNQIRTWAREGRTDAWIAYQLGTTALTVQEFRSEHGLDRGGGNTAEEPVTPELVVQTISFDSPPPPVAPAPAADETGDAAPAARPRRQRRSRTAASAEAAPATEAASEAVADEAEADGEAEPERAKRRRRRGGRGGGSGATVEASAASEPDDAQPEQAPSSRTPTRKRRGAPSTYSGSVAAGAVIVLDPAVARSAAWRANWADVTAFDVVVEDDQIVLRRPAQA
jgi:hypothetical protein